MQVPFLGETLEEAGQVTVLIGPPQDENLIVLFYVEGQSPISTQLAFPGELLGDDRPYGEHIDTPIPLIPVWPDGPDVAITQLASTIGPLHLTYYRRVRGTSVAFHPRGITVPQKCPRGGFRFAAGFDFADGTHVAARSAVPCPSHVVHLKHARPHHRGSSPGKAN